MDAREMVVARRRRVVAAGIVAAVLGLGAADAGPAQADGVAYADEWSDLVGLSFAGTSPLTIRLDADITSDGPNGIVVPPAGSWVIDLVGHTLVITTTGEPAITVEDTAALLIRDTSDDGLGVLRATGATGGAGIGGRYARDGGVLTIEGGTITATGGEGGAGIGGGAGGAGGVVIVTGGTVEATGSPYVGEHSAGIGAGVLGADGGTLTIGGAKVPGSPDLVGADACLAPRAFAAQPQPYVRVDVTAAPECSVTVALEQGELPRITSTGLGAATAGEAFDGVVTATGNPAPTFAVTAGTLPDGLALDTATGRVTGTPTSPGTTTVTVTATNQILGLTQADSAVLTLTVAPSSPPSSGTDDPTAPSDGTGGPVDGDNTGAAPTGPGGTGAPEPAGAAAGPVATPRQTSSGTGDAGRTIAGLPPTGWSPAPLGALGVLLIGTGALLVARRRPKRR